MEFILASLFLVIGSCLVFEFVLWGASKFIRRINLSPLRSAPNVLPIGLREYQSGVKRVSTTSGQVRKPSKRSKKQLKIAVFGGSAAQGYTSERSISEILAVFLKRHDPRAELYVANYAFAGCSFHRGQAELLKAVIDDYDVFVVYAGNNEGSPYFKNNGIWSVEPPKDRTYPDAVVAMRVAEERQILENWWSSFDIGAFFETRSRLYAFLVRVVAKSMSIIERSGRSARAAETAGQSRSNSVAAGDGPKLRDRGKLYPDPFMRDPILPADELSRLVRCFADDLDGICRQLKAKNKTLFYSTVVTNESSPPFFSLTDKDWGAGDAEHATAVANDAQRLIDESRFQSAIDLIASEFGLDNDAAIFNHLVGQSLRSLGEHEKSHAFLRKSIDHDGLYFRSTNKIHDAAKEVVENHDNAFFIDTVGEFQKAIDNGWSWDDVYNDINHATFAGNALIARNLANALIEGLALGDASGRGDLVQGRDLSPAAVEDLARLMGLTDSEKRTNRFMAARWHIGLSVASAYPNYLLGRAATLLDEFESLIDEKDLLSLVYLNLFRSLIPALKGDAEKAMTYANRAYSMHPEVVSAIMAGEGHYISSLPICSVSDVFRDGEVRYSPERGFHAGP